MPIPEHLWEAVRIALEKHIPARPERSRVPQLSHYTTVEGLLGICTNKNIWATCAQYSNDVSEDVYAQSVARDLIEKFFRGRSLTEYGKRIKAV